MPGSDLQQDFSIANQDALFKVLFGKYYTNTFNKSSPLWDRTEKTDKFVGKYMEFPVPTTYKGGVGSGRIPQTKGATYGDVKIYRKKMYASDRVDRESIMASLTSQGAFVEAMSECISKTTEADVWNHNRVLFGDGSGSLGTIDGGGVTDNGGGNYSLVISTATWKEANWEENMFANVHSTGTELFEIQTVTASTRTIVVQRQDGGIQVPVAGQVVYLQGSYNNDPYGLKYALDAVGGNVYNVAVGRKWQAYQDLAVGVGISVPLMNKAMIGVEKRCGLVPDTIVTSSTQFRKLLDLCEDEKRYFRQTKVPSKSVADLSFSGIQFNSSEGDIVVFWDKFCEEDRMYFLNSDHIVYHRAPGHGWVKDDIGGKGYLRVAGEDSFEAYRATYGQIFIAPQFHGVVTGLTV